MHSHAKTKWREKRRKKLTKKYRREVQADLAVKNNPSARGVQWLEYIHHRLRMSRAGIAAHTKRYHARLALDKYYNIL